MLFRSYTFFDQCVLESLPKSTNFPGLAKETQGCVATREMTEGVTMPSEPQLYLGASATTTLPAFAPPAN